MSYSPLKPGLHMTAVFKHCDNVMPSLRLRAAGKINSYKALHILHVLIVMFTNDNILVIFIKAHCSGLMWPV